MATIQNAQAQMFAILKEALELGWDSGMVEMADWVCLFLEKLLVLSAFGCVSPCHLTPVLT